MTKQSQANRNETITKSFSTPDESESFDNGSLDLIEMEGQQIGRIRLQRGWRYDSQTAQQPMSSPHIAYLTKGSLHIKDESGEEITAHVDEVVTLRDGYECWTEEDTEIVDFTNPREFAGFST